MIINRKAVFDSLRSDLGPLDTAMVKRIDAILDEYDPATPDKPINRDLFFERVKKSFGKLRQPQVDGFNKILDEWERRKLTDRRWLANMLAQVWHETGRKMQPIREGGGEAYLRSKWYYPHVGMGLIQVTHRENYAKFGAADNPKLLLEWPLALKALFDGMIRGMFTGKRLSQYFNETTNNIKEARRIVNGLDKWETIRQYHLNFLHALEG